MAPHITNSSLPAVCPPQISIARAECVIGGTSVPLLYQSNLKAIFKKKCNNNSKDLVGQLSAVIYATSTVDCVHLNFVVQSLSKYAHTVNDTLVLIH